MGQDVGLIIAVVGVGIAMVGVLVSMMFWVRSESNALRADQKEDRKDLVQMVLAIQIEMKDFHRSLLEIERNRIAQKKNI